MIDLDADDAAQSLSWMAVMRWEAFPELLPLGDHSNHFSIRTTQVVSSMHKVGPRL